MPIYDGDIYPAMEGNQKIRVFVLDESRGCPERCGFCPHLDKSGSRRRAKKSTRIVEEILRLRSRYQSRAFRYAGSNPPFRVLSEVAQIIIRDAMHVSYTTFGHVREVDLSSLRLLRESGLISVSFGVESGDDEILKRFMLKRSTAAQIGQALKSSISAGLYTIGSVIYPSPGETPRSRQNTLRLLLEVFQPNPDCSSVQVYFPGLFPAFFWGKNPERFGFRLASPESYCLDMANYKFKRLFPPQFWSPLPYTVDGKAHSVFAAETEEMVRELEHNGVTTNFPDELALMSHIYDPLSTVRQFRDMVRQAMYTSDWETVSNLAVVINTKLSV